MRRSLTYALTLLIALSPSAVAAQQSVPGRNQIYRQDGTALNPSDTYDLDKDTGRYRIGTNNEGNTAGGTLRWDWNTVRLKLAASYQLHAGSNVLIGSVADKLNAVHLAIASQAVGDLLYADSTSSFARRAAVASGSVLASAGVGTAPAYTADPVLTSVRVANTGLRAFDTNASHYLSLVPGSNITADRAFTVTTGDADRTLTLSGNPTIADWFDQSVKAASSPTFAAVTTSTYIAAGTSPASTGAWRSKNNDYMYFNNAAGTGDVRAIGVDNSNRIRIGGAGNSTIIVDGSGAALLVQNLDRLAFEGVTSSQVSLRRSGVTLLTELADGSLRAAHGSLYEWFGSGSPEGVVTAPIGAIYHRTDGGAGTSNYFKESGSGNVGWVAK